jgi:copper oxidase (laccase) domain-containing protein
LLAGVGPSAGPTRYEVGEEVYEAAAGLPERERFFPRRDGRLYFDLWEANRSQLVFAGVSPENIEVAGICTISRTDLFYSYRREGPGCGHFCLLAGVDLSSGDDE